MRVFEAEHRDLFFGRRDETTTLIRRLQTESLVIVTGDSSIGKSSLCRAGVLPAVEDGGLEDRRGWNAVPVVPGASPVQALAAALTLPLAMDKGTIARRLRANPRQVAHTLGERLGDDRGLVLLVDQLEDLVTVSDAESTAIVDEALYHLAVGVPGVRVLMTVRSDFLDRIGTQLPRLGEQVGRALYFLRPLSRDGIREAICEPARLANVEIESALQVEAMVQATSLSEWGLPLLQFALARLWEARDRQRGVIPVDAFEKIGTCANAVSDHADEVLHNMTPEERSAARRILTMLVGPRGAPLPRLEEELVAGDPFASAALRHLVRGRLLVAKEAALGVTYALVHEVLITEWKTLEHWLEEQIASRAVRHRLVAAAGAWREHGRSRRDLWRSQQLDELRIVDQNDVGAPEAVFVALSQEQVRLRRRRRVLLGAFVLLVLLLLSICGVRSLVGGRRGQVESGSSSSSTMTCR
jgi:hypothetical protein